MGGGRSKLSGGQICFNVTFPVVGRLPCWGKDSYSRNSIRANNRVGYGIISQDRSSRGNQHKGKM